MRNPWEVSLFTFSYTLLESKSAKIKLIIFFTFLEKKMVDQQTHSCINSDGTIADSPPASRRGAELRLIYFGSFSLFSVSRPTDQLEPIGHHFWTIGGQGKIHYSDVRGLRKFTFLVGAAGEKISALTFGLFSKYVFFKETASKRRRLPTK